MRHRIFSPIFLQLCYEFLKSPKRLVYAYDELQSLSGESLPSPENIFGNKADGSPKVHFDDTEINHPQRDIILDKCYRNSRPLLITAHALGFGIYHETSKPDSTGLIQMFDHPQLWTEVGYRAKDEKLEEGSLVTLYRTEETSPKFLEDHSDIDDLIKFVTFDSEDEQADWLTKQIQNNLEQDELLHDDIIVINPNPLTTREKTGTIRSRLMEMEIKSHLAGVNTRPETFFRSDTKSVTFTGIYRAKGNEAGMVYIINAQDCHSTGQNLANIRNLIFVAITRSKAWVRILGVGNNMKILEKEYCQLKEQNFKLQFIYPTEEQRKQLRIVHRDITMMEKRHMKKRDKDLKDIVQELESGNIHIEDFDREYIEKLKMLLQNKR